jgi:hypothetical protein
VSELADDGALKALAPKGACGFESHPGHGDKWRIGQVTGLSGGLAEALPSRRWTVAPLRSVYSGGVPGFVMLAPDHKALK